MFPTQVRLVEVSPRDGLQNESKIIPTEIKIQFIDLLSHTGLKTIETTSFVSPKWIPQLADHTEVMRGIHKQQGMAYPVLVPNLQGMEAAIAAGATEVAVFTTPSETFSMRNTHCTVAESLQRIQAILAVAKQYNIRVRGYLSCVLGCPYEGHIAPIRVADLAAQLITMGCYEISLGDTIGVGTPGKTQELLEAVFKKTSKEQLAVHFHDTYGQAIANIYVALQQGIQVIDSAVSGIGGCPYAKGATGNVATEDVVYLLNGLGIETGVDMKKLIHAGRFISTVLGRPSQSKVNLALTSQD